MPPVSFKHERFLSIIHEHGLDIPRAMNWWNDFGKDRVKIFLCGIEKLTHLGPGYRCECSQIHRLYWVSYLRIWCVESWVGEISRKERVGSETDRLFRRLRIVKEGLITPKELEALMTNLRSRNVCAFPVSVNVKRGHFFFDDCSNGMRKR
jgi:hypothetical protein